ncbi:hypothetical protein C8R43DRAFT_830428, partial [Mycena crocata]
EYVVVHRDEVLRTPSHLTNEQIADWTLAVSPRGGASRRAGKYTIGTDFSPPGVGGGVALVMLQLSIAMDASVYVTSGSAEKVERTVKLGARG